VASSSPRKAPFLGEQCAPRFLLLKRAPPADENPPRSPRRLATGRPTLLSQARETPLDAGVKERCIADIIALIDPVAYDRDALVDVLDRRLKHAESGDRATGGAPRPVRRRSGDGPTADDAREAALAADLVDVLPGRPPRRVHVPPSTLGDFEVLAPSHAHDKVRRVKRAVCKAPPAATGGCSGGPRADSRLFPT